MTERLHLGSPKAKSRRDVVVDATTGRMYRERRVSGARFPFAHTDHITDASGA
eukprot:CAMPEP_0117624602 /NCGR_PEP_ID=MMETSP0802-20121206/464_1 /TAXON_ID=38833 /ORGANISM="Micromonas sp., Strain CCMP2099" /LENGTH=52 /DNA_ID=CAMNT_0005428645 /DNA_START=451 /DNA_END=610 /DNA_ORIENTATION=-